MFIVFGGLISFCLFLLMCLISTSVFWFICDLTFAETWSVEVLLRPRLKVNSSREDLFASLGTELWVFKVNSHTGSVNQLNLWCLSGFWVLSGGFRPFHPEPVLTQADFLADSLWKADSFPSLPSLRVCSLSDHSFMQTCLFGDFTPDPVQTLHLFPVSSLLRKTGLFVITHWHCFGTAHWLWYSLTSLAPDLPFALGGAVFRKGEILVAQSAACSARLLDFKPQLYQL